MRALACHLGTWDSFRATTGRNGHGGLTFSMHIVRLIGERHGLELDTEMDNPSALFLAVHEFASMLRIGKDLRRLKVPLLRVDREPLGKYPLLWAGGQGTFNPLPLANIVDLVVLGDAEASLPSLLGLWYTHGNSVAFLKAASTVPGVFVPSEHHESEVTLQRGFAPDVSITLSPGVAARQARVEISRGCQKKCSFCGLGWMGKPRHNKAADVLASISGLPSVHLQSCDAEGHPEIARIRESMLASGQIDTGCTSSLDENFDAGSFFYHDKMFNFGIEAVTERVRRRIGKPRLTNQFVADATIDLFRRYADTDVSATRIAWHMIACLPGETSANCAEMSQVLTSIDRRMLFEAKVTGAIQIRWQPLFPQPGTPSQWLPAGHGAQTWSWALRRALSRTYGLKIEHVAGRRDEKNRLVTALTRSGRGGSAVIAASAKKPVLADDVASMLGTSYGAVDPDTALPWDFIRGNYSADLLRRAYRKLVAP